MWILALAAHAHECDTFDPAELDALPVPSVLVLGERHGVKDDMKKALQAVDALADRGVPVTLAMEAVHEVNQPVLDRFSAGEIKSGKLPDALDWSKTWGFPWKPYKKLVTASKRGVPVVASGLKLGPKPEDRELQIPDGYDAFLKAMMGGDNHGMKPEMAARFTTSMTWRDFRIAELAVSGWSGEGVLVILTGKGHIEGGMGTNWQLRHLTEAPVTSVVLGHDGARCEPGDRLWEDG